MALRPTPRSPRGIGLVSPRRLRIARKLDTSVEVPGPHGLTVRIGTHRLRTNNVHCIPHPTFVTIATRPPVSAGLSSLNHNFAISERKIFLREGLDFFRLL